MVSQAEQQLLQQGLAAPRGICWQKGRLSSTTAWPCRMAAGMCVPVQDAPFSTKCAGAVTRRSGPSRAQNVTACLGLSATLLQGPHKHALLHQHACCPAGEDMPQRWTVAGQDCDIGPMHCQTLFWFGLHC